MYFGDFYNAGRGTATRRLLYILTLGTGVLFAVLESSVKLVPSFSILLYLSSFLQMLTWLNLQYTVDNGQPNLILTGNQILFQSFSLDAQILREVFIIWGGGWRVPRKYNVITVLPKIYHLSKNLYATVFIFHLVILCDIYNVVPLLL